MKWAMSFVGSICMNCFILYRIESDPQRNVQVRHKINLFLGQGICQGHMNANNGTLALSSAHALHAP